MWLWSSEYLPAHEEVSNNKNMYTKGNDPYEVMSFYKEKFQNNKDTLKNKRNLWKIFDKASQNILKLNGSESKTNDSYIKSIYCIPTEEEKNQGVENIVLSFSLEKEDSKSKFHTPEITLYTAYKTWMSTTLSIKPEISSAMNKKQKQQRDFYFSGFIVSSQSEKDGVSKTNTMNNDDELVDDIDSIERKISRITEKTRAAAKLQDKQAQEKRKEIRQETIANKKDIVHKKINTLVNTGKDKLINELNSLKQKSVYEKQHIKNSLRSLQADIQEGTRTLDADEELEQHIQMMDDTKIEE